tara:strand:+ start:49 stop:510 length:462 start_codon:yes stop_codon:yes gene_type:complete
MSTKRKRAKKSSTKDTVAETVEAAADSAALAAGETVVTSEEGDGATTSVALEDLKIGYVVGLTQEDRFVFELFGVSKGLVELLGIHQHASKRVNRIYDDQQMSGDRLLHEVGRAVAAIAQRIDGFVGTPEEEASVEAVVADKTSAADDSVATK